jgi:hypothetical protein
MNTRAPMIHCSFPFLLLALFEHGAMFALSPLSAVKPTLRDCAMLAMCRMI